MKIYLVLLSTLFLFASYAWSDEVADSAENCEHSSSEFNCVKFLRNYDGDTYTVDVPGIHSLIGGEIPVRIRGVDAAEIHSSSECEELAAQLAKEEAYRILSGAQRIDLRNLGRGKFFRIVADVYVNGRSLAKRLLRSGHVVKYDPTQLGATDWCHPQSH